MFTELFLFIIIKLTRATIKILFFYGIIWLIKISPNNKIEVRIPLIGKVGTIVKMMTIMTV